MVSKTQAITYIRFFLQELEKELIKEYQQVLLEEETFWCQKLRHEWINSGDKNTNFYHNSVKVRRSRNRIGTLKIDGNWITNTEHLKTHVKDYFQSLFSKQGTRPPSRVSEFSHQYLSDEHHASLTAPATKEEIKSALFSMKALKSPGPDGVQPIFYQKH